MDMNTVGVCIVGRKACMNMYGMFWMWAFTGNAALKRGAAILKLIIEFQLQSSYGLTLAKVIKNFRALAVEKKNKFTVMF